MCAAGCGCAAPSEVGSARKAANSKAAATLLSCALGDACDCGRHDKMALHVRLSEIFNKLTRRASPTLAGQLKPHFNLLCP